ncbi:MAG: hypothetical protein KAS04_06740 [Candidatus Aenigmarchaeota archaeon]|nr:hypothetical protein [Candidatus Aenigmarchaeota archaeon]
MVIEIKPICEYMMNEVLPGFRALVAKKLIDEYNFSQTRAARMLGTTQPAVSQYSRDLRGRNTDIFLNDPNLLGLLENTVKGIASGEISVMQAGTEFCKVCKFMRENDLVQTII